MLVVYALVMPVVLLFCGLTLDVGSLELTKLRMQAAADSGALAAQLEAERGTGNWVTMAQDDASINGFTNGVNNVNVTAFQQPTYGDYQGRWDALEVSISQQIPTVFMWTLSGSPVTVSASAVVLLTPCAYFYGGGAGALTPYGMDIYTGSVLGTSCPIYASYGIDVESQGQMALNAEDITGSSGSSNLAGFYFPTPLYNTVSIPDPLSWETQPTVPATCDHTSYSVSNQTITLNPGYYCKGLNIGGNSFVTFNPGLYIISGGATWSNSHVFGNGVTFLFTKGTASSYGQFIVQSTSVTLTAPTDNSNGGVPGVLVFADRNWVHTGAQDFQLSQTAYDTDGIWYIKGAGMYINTCGTVTGPNYFGVVADNLYTTATIVHFVNNYSSVTTGNPFLKAGQPIGGLVQ